MSSDLHRHTVSRNLVSISGFGYRENIATGLPHAATGGTPVIYRLARLAVAGPRSLPLCAAAHGVAAGIPAPSAT
ncbi:hypothetical protein REJC140_00012 [Pseudorhizobium endolithicum]|uniref:Uncharacterized protein n=1 Tax=Pseudorhizobium endolithicum TaxID=1191678 RepID=A0ABN7JDJ0_9HYPH|nr:hypothetical protein [Pseudorhizobium endolithicum]CAD7022855.1 hypothetical protein REJC140_00012 [Pseudorhizobium endolithicum]